MTRYAWASDTHLDFLDSDEQRIVSFAERLVKDDPDGILLTGDISTGNRLIYHLSVLEHVVQRPILFVLGNHDYWDHTIENMRKQMKELSNMSSFIRYLPTSPYVALTPNTALMGHDGWYDAVNGNWKNSTMRMVDWIKIGEFAAHGRNMQYGLPPDMPKIVEVSRKLATEGVAHLRTSIKAAVRYHKNIVILTHFPPFAESHMHEGKRGDDSAQPWFTSGLMGAMLLDAAQSFPEVNFTVLTGHTHGKFDGHIKKNLYVRVAGADYGSPALAGLIDIV